MIPIQSHAGLVALLLLSGMLSHSFVLAQETGAEPAEVIGQTRDEMLVHKSRLVRTLLEDSAVQARVATSTDRIAHEHWRMAHEVHERASTALSQGLYSEAQTLLADALGHIHSAATRTVDASRNLAIAAEEYPVLEERVKSYASVLKHIVTTEGASAYRLVDTAELDRLRRAARAYASQSQWLKANELLQQAVRQLEAALLEVRDKETVVHRLDFRDDSEEFAYELQRNDSYAKLVWVFPDTAGAQSSGAAPDTLITRNDEYRSQAQALAKLGRHRDAIRHLETATQQLIHRLRQRGMLVIDDTR